jgi:hypothetical protein
MYTVLKDFLSLKKNDIVKVTTFSTDIISLYVIDGRLLDTKEYIEFPKPPINGKQYVWGKKKQQPFEALTFKTPSVPQDLTQEFRNLHSQQAWVEICIEKYINELIDLGVLVKNTL